MDQLSLLVAHVAAGGATMICDRCGEVGETFMTERHGELCAACQRLVEEQEQPQRPPPRDRAGGPEG